MKKHCLATFLFAAALALGVIVLSEAIAQVTKGKERILTTSQLMSGVVKPHCSAIKKALQAGPADDDAWADVATHAAILNEISYTLMDDGRCPDADWANAATKQLRGASAEIVAAAEAKDAEAAMSAFKTVSASCKSCHKAHKED